ncbi:CDP-archaeol synthase [Candidatus Saccharibacteria bacterium]|nr:CDP-archaeol synthase [Candidatus Saccharibacteria bacterium]
MSDWWAAFWFFLPAGIANAAPLFACRLPILKDWNTPIDLGKTWRGKPIFGANKTWRGLLFGTFVAALVGLLQYRVITSSVESTFFIVISTAALGFGALAGDAVESFFKRQIGVKPGDKWFPFDQIDYIIGGLLAVSPFVSLQIDDVLRVLVIYFGLHLITSYIGYLIGFKKTPI